MVQRFQNHCSWFPSSPYVCNLRHNQMAKVKQVTSLRGGLTDSHTPQRVKNKQPWVYKLRSVDRWRSGVWGKKPIVEGELEKRVHRECQQGAARMTSKIYWILRDHRRLDQTSSKMRAHHQPLTIMKVKMPLPGTQALSWDGRNKKPNSCTGDR